VVADEIIFQSQLIWNYFSWSFVTL